MSAAVTWGRAPVDRDLQEVVAALGRDHGDGDGGDGGGVVVRLDQPDQDGRREVEEMYVGPGRVSGQDGTAGHHCQEGFLGVVMEDMDGDFGDDGGGDLPGEVREGPREGGEDVKILSEGGSEDGPGGGQGEGGRARGVWRTRRVVGMMARSRERRTVCVMGGGSPGKSGESVFLEREVRERSGSRRTLRGGRELFGSAPGGRKRKRGRGIPGGFFWVKTREEDGRR